MTEETAAAQVRWKRLANNQRAAWIRAALRATGVSQTELHEMLGVSWPTMSDWTNGKAAPDYSRWMSIAMALGLSQTWQPPPGTLPAPTPNVKRERLPTKKAPAKRKPRSH